MFYRYTLQDFPGKKYEGDIMRVLYTLQRLQLYFAEISEKSVKLATACGQN